MDKTSLGDRMKGYEDINRNKLTRRTPTIIRLDGKAFHTFTKGLDRPFDSMFNKVMVKTMEYLVKNIQGAKIGYTQSDEISILLTDYDRLTTDAWFDKNIQKMVSVAASMATLAFNKSWRLAADDASYVLNIVQLDTRYKKLDTAMFDARVFNLPKEEVNNYFLWRQQDASKNSIQMLAQHNFSHKSLQGLNGSQLQDKLFIEKNINWNDLEVRFKRGVCSTKEGVDLDIPVFSMDRNYIEQHVYKEES